MNTSSENEPVQNLNYTSSESEPLPVQNLNTHKKEKESLQKKDIYPLSYLDQIPEKDIEQFTGDYKCNGEQVLEMAEKIKLYCESQNKRYKNYRATLQGWLLREYKKRSRPSQKARYVIDEVRNVARLMSVDK